MTNFTDDPEKIGRNKNSRKSKNMADAGNKDPQHQEPEEEHQGPQDDETGDPISCSKTKFPIPLLKKALEGAEKQRVTPKDLPGEDWP